MRREVRLAGALAKFVWFDPLVLDGTSYVRRGQDQRSVSRELIAERYERRSLAITGCHPFTG